MHLLYYFLNNIPKLLLIECIASIRIMFIYVIIRRVTNRCGRKVNIKYKMQIMEKYGIRLPIQINDGSKGFI